MHLHAGIAVEPEAEVFTVPSRVAALREIEVRGVPGLPNDFGLAFGGLTAVVGPRASGKSQLLSSIAWLLTGRPRLSAFVGDAQPTIAAMLELDGRRVRWAPSRDRRRPVNSAGGLPTYRRAHTCARATVWHPTRPRAAWLPVGLQPARG